MPVVSLSYEHKMTGLLEKLGLLERSVDMQACFADARSEETSDGAIVRTLEHINALLDADTFTPPRLDPRAFVLEGFEKLCGALRAL